MRILVYADLQATDGSDLCFTRPGVPLQHYRMEKFFQDLSAVYDRHNCNAIVDLGDTTDDRSAIPMNTLDVLCAGLAGLPKGSKRRWKLTGNHEQFLRDTTINNHRLFEPYFEVVQDRTIVSYEGYTLFFCSYPADHQELARWIALEASKVRSRKILFGHFQVKGAMINNSQTTSGIPLEALSGFDQVLLGHIHTPQSLHTRVHYVGSPFQQDWGETSQKKRVGIVDTSTMRVEWVEITGYPEYREVKFDDFRRAAADQAEHRYRVVLDSHQEAERFFAHPLFNRAVGVYNYDTGENDQPEAEVRDWSFEGTLRRYLQAVPPAGVDLNQEDMLDVGKMLVEGT